VEAITTRNYPSLGSKMDHFNPALPPTQALVPFQEGNKHAFVAEEVYDEHVVEHDTSNGHDGSSNQGKHIARGH